MPSRSRNNARRRCCRLASENALGAITRGLNRPAVPFGTFSSPAKGSTMFISLCQITRCMIAAVSHHGPRCTKIKEIGGLVHLCLEEKASEATEDAATSFAPSPRGGQYSFFQPSSQHNFSPLSLFPFVRPLTPTKPEYGIYVYYITCGPPVKRAAWFFGKFLRKSNPRRNALFHRAGLAGGKDRMGVCGDAIAVKSTGAVSLIVRIMAWLDTYSLANS